MKTLLRRVLIAAASGAVLVSVANEAGLSPMTVAPGGQAAAIVAVDTMSVPAMAWQAQAHPPVNASWEALFRVPR